MISASNPMKNTKLAVIGTVLGQAIGDAMGHPVEFSKNTFVTDLAADNTFTDDTQMMLGIAEAILTARAMPSNFDIKDTSPLSDIEALMQEMGQNWIRWDNGDPRWGANNRSPGGTCMSGVRRLRQSTADWRDSGSGNFGKGNGGVMRVSVVGAAYWRNPFAAFQIGGLSSVPTHNNLESIIASAVCAAIIAQCIQGKPFSYALGQALEWAAHYEKNLLTIPQGNTDEFAQFAIGRLGSAFALAKGGMNHSDFRAYNGNDFKGVEALAAAIFWNARRNNYKDIVTGLVNYTGDCDTTAAIGGAIAGARFGASMIPTKWRTIVEKSPYLHDVANRIYQFSTEVGDTRRELARTV